MATVLVKDRITSENIKKASEDYGSYIKITADLVSEIIVIGGEWHADGEKILLENGSRQSDIWGGGINYETKEVNYTALINIRPGVNESMEILDRELRKTFEKLIKRKFNLHE